MAETGSKETLPRQQFNPICILLYINYHYFCHLIIFLINIISIYLFDHVIATQTAALKSMRNIT